MLRAIREYTGNSVCSCTGEIKTHKYYVVTFADKNGIVVAEAHFGRKEEADFIVESVNNASDLYHKDHCGSWDD